MISDQTTQRLRSKSPSEEVLPTNIKLPLLDDQKSQFSVQHEHIQRIFSVSDNSEDEAPHEKTTRPLLLRSLPPPLPPKPLALKRNLTPSLNLRNSPRDNVDEVLTPKSESSRTPAQSPVTTPRLALKRICEPEKETESGGTVSPRRIKPAMKGNNKGLQRRAVALDRYGFQQTFTPSLTHHQHYQAPKKLTNISQSFKQMTATLHWNDYMASLNGDFNKIRRCKNLKYLIRVKGIPPNFRGELWPRISNGYQRYSKNVDTFSAMLQAKIDQPNPWTEQIEKDLPRTFPTNVWFHRDEVQNSLKRVLHCFAWMKPDVGYTQAMNYITAMLLLFTKEEVAFWMICTVVEDLLPPNYYCNELIGVRIDVEVFKIIFKQRLPKLASHFQTYDVDVGLFVTQWFLCLYISLLPNESATRFLDAFLYEGSKMLFRVALALFNMNKQIIFSTKEASLLLDVCQRLPSTATDPNLLMEYAYDEKTLLGFSIVELGEYRKFARMLIDPQMNKS